MAILFTDGFDNYGTSTGTNLLTRWATASNPNGVIVSTTPYGYGQAFDPGSSTSTATVPFTATSTVTVGANIYIPTTLAAGINYPIFGFLSSGTSQVGLNILVGGGINIARGFNSGTTIIAAGATNGTIKIGQWYYIEFSVTISDTVGTVRVDVDGRTVINQTGLDTRNGTPTTVNTLQIASNDTNRTYFDDLYISDSITPLGPQRIYTLKPNADTAEKDWTPTAGWNIQDTTTTSLTNSTSGNATKGNVFTSLQNTSLTGISVYCGALAQTVKVGIAELTGSNVASVLYESGTVARAASAGYQSFTFSPVSLTSGKTYYIYATRTDGTGTSVLNIAYTNQAGQLSQDPTGALTCTGFGIIADNAIATNDAVSVTTIATAAYNMYVNYSTSNNYQGVQDTYDTDGDASYVTASNVGDFDLYDVSDYPNANANIKAVNHIVWAKKTDATVRTMNLTTKSGATTTDSSAVTLTTAYNGYSNIYETDPNTSTAWDVSGVNALQIGQKVAS